MYNEFFIILYNVLKIAELDCSQIIILSIYPAMTAFTDQYSLPNNFASTVHMYCIYPAILNRK
jgi:hypothetical protein